MSCSRLILVLLGGSFLSGSGEALAASPGTSGPAAPSVSNAGNPAADWKAVAVGLQNNRSWRAGKLALGKGLNDQAAEHFQKALSGGKLSEREQAVVKAALGEAYVRSGMPDKALEALENVPVEVVSPYWKGASLAMLGRFAEAVPLLLEVGMNDAACGVPSRRLLAEAARRLGREELLLSALDDLIGGGGPNDVLDAKLAKAEWLLDHGRTEGVAELLREVVSSSGTNAKGSAAAWAAELLSVRLAGLRKDFRHALELVRGLSGRGKLSPLQRDALKLEQSTLYALMEQERHRRGNASPEEDEEDDPGGKSEEVLLHLIASTPDSPVLAEAFRRLDASDAFSSPLAFAKLEEWSKGNHARRTPLALLTMARLLHRRNLTGEALACVQLAAANYPRSGAARLLVQEGVRWLLEHDRLDEAAQLLAQLRERTPRTLFETGAIAYKEGRFDDAAAAFDEAMRLADESLYAPAAVNACLASLKAGAAGQVDRLLERARENPEVHASLLYERARYLVSSGNVGAEKAMKNLMRLYPNAPEADFAKMDLASLCLSYAPKRAARYLDELPAGKTDSWPLGRRWRLVSLRIEVAEAMRESGETWRQPEDLALEALKLPFPPEERAKLHMKYASLLFRNERYAEALAAMKSFLKDFPGSPYEGAAQYLAAQSAEHLNTAASLKQAMEWYAACAAGSSTFAVSAAIAQASVAIRLARTDEALRLLDRLMAERRLDGVDRAWVLATKAEAFAASPSADEAGLEKARELCAEALAIPGLPPAWRYRTLIQRARLAEKLGRLDEALADYRAILTADPSALPSPRRKDWYWYNAAGFASVDLLVKKGDYRAAAALADEMARKPGTRAREAAEWARRIRLEHFVWDEEEN